MSIDSIVNIVAAFLVLVGLMFAGCQVCLSRRTLSLHLFERVFLEIKSLEKEIEDLEEKGDKSTKEHWKSRFLNTLEFFSFLVNKKYFAPHLASFFEDAFKVWYEAIFKNSEYYKDENAFPEMRKTYSKLK